MKTYNIIILFLAFILCGCSIAGDPEEITWVEPPQSVYFTDTDGDTGEVGGVVTIIRAADEYNVDCYSIYWATSNNEKAELITEIPKTGGDLVCFIPPDTDIGDYSYLSVFTRNNENESRTYVSAVITDHTGPPPVNFAREIIFDDEDTDQWEISGNIEIKRAEDESDITAYCLYYADNGFGGYDLIGEKQKTGLNIVFTIPENTKLNNYRYFFVRTKNNVQEMTDGTFCRIIDKVLSNDLIPPEINITDFPSIIYDSFTGMVNISDNIEIREVTAKVNENSLLPDISGNDYSYNIDYKLLNIGSNTVTVTASDTAGNETVRDINVEKRDNIAPVIGEEISAIYYPAYQDIPPISQRTFSITLNDITDNDSILEVIISRILLVSPTGESIDQINNPVVMEKSTYEINTYFIGVKSSRDAINGDRLQLTVIAIDTVGNNIIKKFIKLVDIIPVHIYP